MSDFDPGPGWREVTDNPMARLRRPQLRYTDQDERTRAWIREEPVPPLPTEPYTVIRVTWKHPQPLLGTGEVLLLNRAGAWQIEDDQFRAEVLAAQIAGFEVLAEPRAMTAEAVLDRVRQQAPKYIPRGNIISAANHVAGEFNVASGG